MGSLATASSALTAPQDSLFSSSQDTLLSSQDSLSSSKSSRYSSRSSPTPQTLCTSSQPVPPSQNDIISFSFSSSLDAEDSRNPQDSQDSNASTITTNIYKTLSLVRQNLSQRLRLSPEQIATHNLLQNLADIRPLSQEALENLGAGAFADMVFDHEGDDAIKICRRG